MHGRGRKLNQTKNYVAAADFAAGKKVGRPKQQWIPPTLHGEAIPEDVTMDDIVLNESSFVPGHWEKVNALK